MLDANHGDTKVLTWEVITNFELAGMSKCWGGCSSVGRAGGPVIRGSLVRISSPGVGLGYMSKYP